MSKQEKAEAALKAKCAAMLSAHSPESKTRLFDAASLLVGNAMLELQDMETASPEQLGGITILAVAAANYVAQFVQECLLPEAHASHEAYADMQSAADYLATFCEQQLARLTPPGQTSHSE